MALIMDTGGLIAFDRGDREVAALVEAARRRREPVRTASGCVAQAWRDGGARQALLSRLLAGLVEFGLMPQVSRRTGELCGDAAVSDVVDAHLSLLVQPGDVVLTSDEEDIRHLLATRGVAARVRRC